MTRTELLRAFELRLDGAPWDDVAQALNYSTETVMAEVYASLRGRRRAIKCCYPAIRRVIQRDHGSMAAFSEYCGVPLPTLYHLFSGHSKRPQRKTVDAVLLATGLPYDEAFQKEDPHVPL